MSIEPKVSCICITHNRLDMFERALHCFLKQTYDNRELVVIFENDAATEDYIRNNKRYNYYTLHQAQQQPRYFLETRKDESYPLLQSRHVSIKDIAGSVFTCIDGVFQFHNDVPPDFNVSIDGFAGNRFSLKYGDHWVNFNADGTFAVVSDESHAVRYGHTHHLDCVFSLDISADRESNTIEQIGWQRQLVHEGEVKNVSFYNIFPSCKMSLGMKRNLSIRVATGDYICVWDDDDWYAADRISNQMTFLQFTGKAACSLAYTILFDTKTGRAYYNAERPTGHENSLIFKKQGAGVYGNLNAKEDTPLLVSFYNTNALAVMEAPDLYIYNYHRKNTSSSKHFEKVIADALQLNDEQAMKVKKILKTPVELP